MDIKIDIEKLKEIFNVKTQKQLAEALGISHSAIDGWKYNNKLPDKYQKYIYEYEIYIRKNNIETDLFQDFENYPYEEKQRILYQNCKKYDIQTTSLSNLRLLYLIQELEKYSDEKKLEKKLKDLLLNSNPLFNGLDEKNKDIILENLEKKINEFEEENK